MPTSNDEARSLGDGSGIPEASRPGWVEDQEVVQWLHGIYFANCSLARVLNTLTEIELENGYEHHATAAFHSILSDIRNWCAGMGFPAVYWHVGDATEAPLYKMRIHQWVPAEMQGAFVAEIERLASNSDERLEVFRIELNRRDAVANQAGMGSITKLDRARLVRVRLRSSAHATSGLIEQWDEVRKLLRGRVFPSALIPGFDTAALVMALEIPAHPVPEQLRRWCCGVSEDIGQVRRTAFEFLPQRWDPSRLRESVFPTLPYDELERAGAASLLVASSPTRTSTGEREQITTGARPPREIKTVKPSWVEFDQDCKTPRLDSEIGPSQERLRWVHDEFSAEEGAKPSPSARWARRMKLNNHEPAMELPQTDRRFLAGAPANVHAQLVGTARSKAIMAALLQEGNADERPQQQDQEGGFLSIDSYWQLRKAAEFSALRGWPLNGRVTIAPKSWGIYDAAECRKVLNEYIKLVGTWFGDKGHKPVAWLYVWESMPDMGCHVHMAIHVPDHLKKPFCAWNAKRGARFDRIPNRVAPKNEPDVEVRPLGDRVAHEHWLEYFGKHLDPKLGFLIENGRRKVRWLDFFGADKHWEGPCHLPNELGKRSGTSQSIGPTAMTRFDARPLVARLEENLKRRAGG